MKYSKLMAVVFTIMFGLAFTSSATVLVSNVWNTGVRTYPTSADANSPYSENGTDYNTSDDLESAWFNAGGSLTSSVGHLTQAMPTNLTSSATWTTYFTPEASPVTLSGTGDQLKITWVFTPTGVNSASTSATGFRIAVVDSPTASRLASDTSPGSFTYGGYGMFMNMATTLASSTPFRLMERTDPVTASALLSSSGSWVGLANGATAGNHGYDSGTQYTYVMTITRNSSSGVDVTSTMTGGTLNGTGSATVSFTDSTPSSMTYDTFCLRPSSANDSATNLDTTLFKVEFIPGSTPPSISVNLTNQSAALGDDVTFSVGASGTAPLVYQWYYNTNTVLTGQTNASLTVTNAQLADAGGYSVVVTNGSGAVTSAVAQLTVSILPPSIDTDPQSQSALVGQTASLTVSASGTAPLSYQWYYNTNTVLNDQTNSLLLLNNVQLADSGGYSVVVTNVSGVVTSAVAQLTVSTPVAPSITTQPQNQVNILPGATATFSVTVSGSEPLSYQWYYNTNTPVANATDSTLAIADVQPGNAGSYSVTVSNIAGGVVSSNAFLTVDTNPVAPAFITQPASQVVLVGDTATFTASASGTAPITYQWSKNGTPISGATSATLTLTNVQTSDSASYVVSASNIAGSTNSSAAVLTVTATIPVVNSAYNLMGFGRLATGGGVIADTNAGYAKVSNALQLATAVISFNKNNGIKVIEIMNDLDLGWNEIGSAVKSPTLASSPFNAGATPQLHPRLITTGVSVIDIKGSAGGLTIFSTNGATIRHCTFNIKGTKNIIIRNLKFDEMWEWDEASKGNYDKNDWDFIDIGNGSVVSNVWIDHCTFTKAYDGISDIKGGSFGITFSWCRYIGDDGASNTNSFVWQQINALETNKAAYAMYNAIRNAGFSTTDIVTIIQGHDKTHLVGANDGVNNGTPYNANHTEEAQHSLTFHHQWFQNCWDRCVPRLRAGSVHSFNIYVDDTVGLAAKRLRAQHTVSSSYSFQPFLNGSISTEGGAILLEKSIYKDCITPLRNNQTDVNNPLYTGKIMALDTIYQFDSTVVRGDSTNSGNPLGPFQAPIIPFSWNTNAATPGGVLPYTYTMDDPSQLQSIVTSPTAGAGAGVLTWAKTNWLMTSYPDTAPSIVTPPQNQTVTEGNGATFTVVAGGTPTLTYQWYFNTNTPLANQTNSSLTLNNVQTNNAGAYSVVVTNGSGSVTSSVATLTVNLASPVPAVTTPPANQTVALGQSASFSVIASGTAPLIYQWYFNTNTPLANQTNSSLTLNNVTTNDAGGYSVIITNSLGSVTSTVATLTVTLPVAPSIDTQPTNRTVNTGQNTTFIVAASGTAPLSYQWYYNTNTPLSNQTNSSLTLNSVTTNNNGGYSVIITNGGGSITSSVATLTVNPPAAGLLAYEPFTNAPGTAIIGSSDGFGFSGAWAANSSGGVATNTGYGLDYTDSQGSVLVTSGGAGLFQGLTSANTSMQPTRQFNFSRGTNGTDNATTWISFLIVRQGPTVGGANSYTRGANVAHDMNSGGLQKLAIGNSSGAAANNVALIPTGNATNNKPSVVSFSQTNFVVVRIDHNLGANDNTYLFVNPLLSAEPSVGSASTNSTGSFDFSFDRIRVFAGGDNSGSGQPYAEILVDEYRVGQSYADVTPYTGAPSITTQPTNRTVYVGQNPAFVVVAAGSSPLGYQWYFNTNTVLTGATNASLVLSNAQTGDAGQYSVVVSNAIGSVTSSIVTLTVLTCPTITVGPATLPDPVKGQAYAATNTASGGTAPYTFSVGAGLPAGLTLAANGAISGTTTNSGSFTVTATDANGCTGSSNYTLAATCPTITLSPATLPNPVKGHAYAATNAATGGTAPYTFSVGSGLPDGLTLATNGVISGTTTNDGSFTVTATDAFGCSSSPSNYSITVSCPSITVGPATLPAAVLAVAYGPRTNTAGGGAAPYTYAVTSNALPDGLSLSADGVISGTPTNAGTYHFTITATDANACAGGRDYTVTAAVAALNQLVIYTNGPGSLKATKSKWGTPTNGAVLRPGTNYTLQAVIPDGYIFSNWVAVVAGVSTNTSPNAKLTFTYASDLELTATFTTNLFFDAAGGYSGLFWDTNNGVAFRSAGLAAIKVTATKGKPGKFSGTLSVAGEKPGIAGTFDAGGNGVNTKPVVFKNNTNVLGLRLYLAFDGKVSGIVSNTDGSWTSELNANRSAGSHVGQSYTMILPGSADPAVAPGGAGYGLVNIKTNGSLKLTGALGDGAAISQTVPVSENGDWPLYAPAYKDGSKVYQGLLLGWMTLTNGLDGTLTLIKQPFGSNYVGGFTNTFVPLTSGYTNPGAGSPVVGWSNGLVHLSGGNLPVDITNLISLSVSNKFTAPKTNTAGGTNKLTMAVTVKTGKLTGGFKPDGVTGQKFAGAVLQGDNTGGGHFLAPTNTGAFLLEQAP